MTLLGELQFTSLKTSMEEMICRILLIFILTSCVCAASLNVTQSWYQAEENHNISLEWMFPTSSDSSLNSLYILCRMLNPDRPSVLFQLDEGIEVPQAQDQRFAGRVQCDKDVLREGRLRLHISRLQTNDSGSYSCSVYTSYGMNFKCHLNVTAVKDPPGPETRSVKRWRGDPRGRMGFYCALVLAAALLVTLFCLCIAKKDFLKCLHRKSQSSD